MTTANKITILRILLVPFFIVQVVYYVETGNEWNRLWAILSFAIAAMSDALDGYIARKYNQHTELGAVLDPLADKLLLVSGMVLLSLDHRPLLAQLPIWLVATVFSRDVILVLGMGIIYYACGKVTVRPRFIGKIATVLQMIAVLWTLLKWNEGKGGIFWHGWVIGAALGTGISGLLYIQDGVRQLNASPSSTPKPRP
jgi:CDP-diacylglycerol--glycerol-3-phosphate 3-phosphatidyltransferase